MKYKFTFIFLLVLSVFLLSSCEFLQSGLSSELLKKLNEETGAVSINGTVWYYPGASDMNMSLAPKSELALNISKKAAVIQPEDPSKPNGLTGSFQVKYLNTQGKQSAAELPFKGGHFNDDFSVFYLDTSPISELLNPGLNPSGKGMLEMTISGFVNNEDGDQKGRPLPPFTTTIDFAPLFPGREIFFSTREPIKGRSIEIPVNAPITLTPMADFVIKGGTGYPKELFQEYFTLSLSPDGRTILLTPDAELYEKEFDFSVTIIGIIPPLSSLAAECTFNVHITNSLVILDGVKDPIWNEAYYVSDPLGDAYSDVYPQPGNEITGMYVLNDTNRLYVAFEFASLSNFWENDRIGILIDKAGNDKGDTTESLAQLSGVPRLSQTMTIENGTAFVYFAHIPGAAAGKGNSILRAEGKPVGIDLYGNPQKLNCSQYGWMNPNGPLFLEYSFSLADLLLAEGDQIRVFGVLSNHWDSDDSIHCTDIVPGERQVSSRNAVYNFNKGLAITLGKGPNPPVIDSNNIKRPEAPSYLVVSESGVYNNPDAGVRLRWGRLFNADYYELHRGTSENGAYTNLGKKLTSPSGADWTAQASQTYWYKVRGINKGGAGEFSRPVGVTMTGTINRYPVISMVGGILEDAFLDPDDAVQCYDSLSPGSSEGNVDIKAMYVTNDENNIYIALDFGSSPPKSWKFSRFCVYIDNPDHDGAAVLTGSGNGSPPNRRPAVNTIITRSGGTGLSQFIAKQLCGGWDGDPNVLLTSPAIAASAANPVTNAHPSTNTPLTTGGASYPGSQWFEDSEDSFLCYPQFDIGPNGKPRDNPLTVIKFRVPRSNVAAEAEGIKIYIFAAFSPGNDNWPEPHDSSVGDIIPSAAAPGAVFMGNTLTVNMANALSYTTF
jgi:hypothetical protein